MTERFEGIEACVFDAYGTLFDVHSAVARCRDDFGLEVEAAQVMSDTWRSKQLAYSWLRSLMGAEHYVPFWQVTGEALDFALETAFPGGPPTGLRQALMDSYRTLETYPEVIGVLQALKAAGMKTAILSNGSPDMLESVCDSTGCTALLDAVLSVDELGVFKPDPRVYQLAMAGLGVSTPGAISFQSSNAWDAAAASAFGFRVVWCNRFGQARERLPGSPDIELKTLESLPAILGLA
ncbi:haloacid dehalogenase type II [Thalassobaculum salexigens]|uniref:haloacid dehalogenase type II n=1 Tax=Thalassobaculum salexigens TaxID=455360 RepID=UPI00248DF188|nr:haloacid dehalogenase type II [Thalassobaculum salexigens]